MSVIPKANYSIYHARQYMHIFTTGLLISKFVIKFKNHFVHSLTVFGIEVVDIF